MLCYAINYFPILEKTKQLKNYLSTAMLCYATCTSCYEILGYATLPDTTLRYTMLNYVNSTLPLAMPIVLGFSMLCCLQL